MVNLAQPAERFLAHGHQLRSRVLHLLLHLPSPLRLLLVRRAVPGQTRDRRGGVGRVEGVEDVERLERGNQYRAILVAGTELAGRGA